VSYTREQIADALDLAVLNPTADPRDIIRVARKVEKENIRTICVAPSNVRLAHSQTKRITAVVGFPHGNTLSAVKVLEASLAIGHGARELDVVINYGHFLAGKPKTVHEELTLLVHLFKPMGVPIKAILETCYYQPDQIRDACKLCVDCGVDFVKTSTGFGSGGASVEAVKVMVEAVNGNAQVKASGGIKTYADAARYLDLGCTCLGSSVFEELLP
jgi:deoxyribose-phosphate aldolase